MIAITRRYCSACSQRGASGGNSHPAGGVPPAQARTPSATPASTKASPAQNTSQCGACGFFSPGGGTTPSEINMT